MKTIYGVGRGEYEAYGLVCAFATLEEAEAAVELGIGDCVDELTMYDPGEVPQSATYWYASCSRWSRPDWSEIYTRSEVWFDNQDPPRLGVTTGHDAAHEVTSVSAIATTEAEAVDACRRCLDELRGGDA